MYPQVGKSPVNLAAFPELEGVLDVVYNPARTQILLDAEKRGIVAMNGLLMLVAQAKEAAEWFTGKNLYDDVIPEIHAALRCQMENVVIVGMPGCGKTTLGTALAQTLGRQFIDADAEIVSLAGKPIPEIFAQDGEAVFRDWETKVLAELGKQSGLVIATGGGCVTRERNYSLLHQNGTVLWLRRDLTKLPTDGRPLSQKTKLLDMYAVRKPLYEAFADRSVDNDGPPDITLAQILEVLK